MSAFTYKFTEYRGFLSLRIIHDRKQAKKSLGIPASKTRSGNLRFEDKVEAEKLMSRMEAKLIQLKHDLADGKVSINAPTDVIRILNDQHEGTMKDWCAAMLKERKQVKGWRSNTCRRYEIAIGKLDTFRKDAHFDNIDEDFLNGYIAHLRAGKHAKKDQHHAKANSSSTIRKEIDHLSHIWNYAAERMKSNRQSPFRKIRIKKTSEANKNSEKVLSRKEIKKLKEANLEGLEAIARDVWMFCFYCFGMRIGDALTAKPEWFNGDELSYVPSKTSKYQKKLVFTVSPEVSKIVNRYAKQGQEFIFPFCANDSAKEKDAKAALLRKYLTKAAKRIGINDAVSYHWARHSFATMLFNEKQDISLVSQVLAHSDVTTTINYLASLGFHEVKTKTQDLKVFEI